VTEKQAQRLAPLGLLADRPETLLVAWQQIERIWSDTVDRALELPSDALDRRVNGEWSFLETLRHLIFVTDGWILRDIRGAERPLHPLGLPPHFITSGIELGLDLGAQPSIEGILAVRADRMRQVQECIQELHSQELDRRTPPGFTVLGAIQVVIFEEWAHHEYTTRDLVRL
jgi:hypothetical protein